MKILKYAINTILISIMIFAIYAIVRNLFLEATIEIREPSGLRNKDDKCSTH